MDCPAEIAGQTTRECPLHTVVDRHATGALVTAVVSLRYGGELAQRARRVCSTSHDAASLFRPLIIERIYFSSVEPANSTDNNHRHSLIMRNTYGVLSIDCHPRRNRVTVHVRVAVQRLGLVRCGHSQASSCAGSLHRRCRCTVCRRVLPSLGWHQAAGSDRSSAQIHSPSSARALLPPPCEVAQTRGGRRAEQRQRADNVLRGRRRALLGGRCSSTAPEAIRSGRILRSDPSRLRSKVVNGSRCAPQ
jgi:hypothetical protein